MAHTSPHTMRPHQLRHHYDIRRATYTFARDVQLLPLQLLEHVQELLHEAHNLCRDLVFVLHPAIDLVSIACDCEMQSTHTVTSGLPCEKPVPTGCSTNKMLDRFVQLNSFCVGCACPYDHWNGCTNLHQSVCDGRHKYADIPRSPVEDPRERSTRGRRSSCGGGMCISSHSPIT